MALALSIFFFCLHHVHSSDFLKATPKERNERVSEEDIRSSLLEEVEGTLGEGSATNRLRLVEATLKPMFDSLPKNEHGNLGHTAVRYALHRFFVMRHGWNINGLGFHSAESNLTSTEGILKDQVPAYLQNMFEKELGAKGLGLHELSVMASALEHLIHKEAVSKLGSVFKIFKVFPTTKVTETQADEILDTYMSAFILGENLTNLSLFDARSLNDEMPEAFSSWRETQALVRRIRSNLTTVSNSTKGSAPRYAFSSLAKIVQAIGEEYGSFQNTECQQLKSALVKMDPSGIGRVKLADFYQPALDGNWQFQESVAYLRHVGALDESVPNSKSVILVNYLHSHANCIASSGYYSVCCKNECESLLGYLEEQIAAPRATPAAIAALVENLPSSTVTGSRKLSPELLKRLDEIAALHDGSVPLHARLFSQWMHHAYPRECPYPHVSGTTSQQDMDEWAMETGLKSLASDEEIRTFTSAKEPLSKEQEEGDRIMASLPWSPEEELLVVRATPRDKGFSSLFSLRPLILSMLIASSAMAMMQMFKTGSEICIDGSNHKFLV
mmetsp:Transcript_59847/g.92997  ORF Transcript_59847/g.92997 Transcript_59847/m.92997 type:complete len:557 (-) Transcript_59847:45-1715(-)